MTSRSGNSGRVILLLDFSGSMKGERISALRSTFAGLSGTDNSASGKFVQFYQGETFELVRFGGRILAEQTTIIDSRQDLRAVQNFLADDDFDGQTAIWSALDHAYRRISRLARNQPQAPMSIVLMTDGENNAGIGLEEFLRGYRSLPQETRAVHTYTIRFGDANPAALERAARATGGRMVDATTTSLHEAFKEIRGCGH